MAEDKSLTATPAESPLAQAAGRYEKSAGLAVGETPAGMERRPDEPAEAVQAAGARNRSMGARVPSTPGSWTGRASPYPWFEMAAIGAGPCLLGNRGG